jgi:hypothetical protein
LALFAGGVSLWKECHGMDERAQQITPPLKCPTLPYEVGSNSRLLGSQDDQWIDPRGTPRRNRAGDEHDDREQRGDAAER